LPDALIGILHNSQWLLFHPRAVTPLGSSPRTRIAASVHYACSHLCICVLKVIKSITHTKGESQVGSDIGPGVVRHRTGGSAAQAYFTAEQAVEYGPASRRPDQARSLRLEVHEGTSQHEGTRSSTDQ
jgi:hypothetical protein